MEINKAIQTPNGTVVFQGELNQEELDLVLTLGLNILLEQGAIPSTVSEGNSSSFIIEDNDKLQ